MGQRRMRSLTPAEARVIRVLLADPPGPERRRIREARAPRTTYQAIRLRAFANRWIEERYLPHPSLFGSQRIRFVLAQPYSERWNEAIRRLRSLDGLVTLWGSPETLFGVVFDLPSAPPATNPCTGDLFRRSWIVSPDITGEGIIAYFDYEGAFSRWALDLAPLAYPRGLPVLNPTALPRSRADWLSIRELLVRPGLAAPLVGSSAFRTAGLSRRGRKVLANGWVRHCVLPDLSELPPIRGYRPERIVFVTATPLRGSDPRNLFTELVRLGRVAPFLFAYDSDRILFATLSPPPAPRAASNESIVNLLSRHASKVETVREAITSFVPVVNHRYEKLPIPGMGQGDAANGR